MSIFIFIPKEQIKGLYFSSYSNINSGTKKGKSYKYLMFNTKLKSVLYIRSLILKIYLKIRALWTIPTRSRALSGYTRIKAVYTGERVGETPRASQGGIANVMPMLSRCLLDTLLFEKMKIFRMIFILIIKNKEKRVT